MDESGGSGQPRSGKDEAPERHAEPSAPEATGTGHPATERHATPPDAPGPAGPADETPTDTPEPSPSDPEPQADAARTPPRRPAGQPPATNPERPSQAPDAAPGSRGAASPRTPAAHGEQVSPTSADQDARGTTGQPTAVNPQPPTQSPDTAPGPRGAVSPRTPAAHGEQASPSPADEAPQRPAGQPTAVNPQPPAQSPDAAPGPHGAAGHRTLAAHGDKASGDDSHADPHAGPHGAAGHRTPAHSHPADPQDPAGPSGAAGHRTPAASGRKARPPRRAKEPGGGLLMGRPFGVPVYVAPSWFLVAALITWVFGGQLDRVLPELGNLRYLVSLFFAVAFYASVLVHELAHTVAALRFKLPVRRIQLQFFGGVSEIEKESETPGREFVLAFVGPLLSLVLAGLFYLALQGVEPGTVPGVLLAGLMISNLIVAAFNLLPGLPLDGGRMLRAVVWKITGRPMSGTVAAAWVGRALAVSVLIGLPLLTQSGALGDAPEDIGGMDTVMDALLAAILAAIIWTGAGNSLRMARLREHLPELRARSLTRRAVPVETSTPLSEALRRANEAGARALVVVDPDGEPLSLVREAAIVGVPEHRRPWVAVSGLAQDLTEGMRVSAELAGEELLDVLRATPATEYLVVEDSGEIYGVLSAADVERAFVKAMARPS
ncbi:site-2 protease family protein [Streptomyces sp. NPDC004082]|uniref:site-2 protease family protein n=1 Tax=Streptomyces sp. NPDC005496 TaxID=3364716 RepID=UPI0036B04217